jgi:hypothetical protein
MASKQPVNVLSSTIKSQFKSNPLPNKQSLNEESLKSSIKDDLRDSKLTNELHGGHSPILKQPIAKQAKPLLTKKSVSNSLGKSRQVQQPILKTANSKIINPMFNSNPVHPNVVFTHAVDTYESPAMQNNYGSEKSQQSENLKLRVKKQSSSMGKEQINVITTNFTTENNGKENTLNKINEYEFFEGVLNKESNNEIDRKNYTSNRDKLNISDQMETDFILSNIDKLKLIFKANDPNNMTKLIKSERNQIELNHLNQMLNSVTATNTNSLALSDKKINVINSNMLSGEFFSSQSITTPSKESKAVNHNTDSKKAEEEKKEKINTEIYTNSDLRIKRYGILLDFINTNLKEINDLVCNKNNEASLYKIDEVNSNKMSSLHSRINLNSRTNLLEKDNIYDYEDSEMQEYTNIAIVVKGKIEYKNQVANPFKNNIADITKSILVSSINSDFYQDLLEGSFNNIQSFLNISNDMSSIRTMNERGKMERHFNDVDRTQVNKGSFVFNNERNRYIEGEENIDSDGDRTKENIQVADPYRMPFYSQLVKDMDRNKVKHCLIFRLQVLQMCREQMKSKIQLLKRR